MTATRPSLRRSARGLLTAHPLLWFVTGVLFAGQLPGEPLHDRLWLAVLLVLAVLAGISYEALRRVDLHGAATPTCPVHGEPLSGGDQCWTCFGTPGMQS